MPAKLSLICLIHSVSEKDSTNYIIREAIAIVRKEDNTSMDIKITSFIPKTSSVPRWVPVFENDNVLRLTGKFILDEEPPHGILQVTANAGDIIEITKDNLPASSISVFITGFVVDQAQNDDNMFKSIKIVTTEFVGGGNSGKKFYIKCRYLRTDERIEKKVSKVRKNSSVMIIGELTLVNSEFKVEIQDLNFLPTSIANIESPTAISSSASSLYSWPTTLSSKISAQELANSLTSESSTPAVQTSNTVLNEEINNDEDNTPANIQTPTRRKRTRK